MTPLSPIHQRTLELLHLYDDVTDKLYKAFKPALRLMLRQPWSKVPGILRPVVGIFLVNLVRAKRRYFGEDEE